MIDRKNATIGLDRDEVKEMYGRKLFRVVATAAIASMGVQEGDRGGWCSEEAVVTDKVLWVPSLASFWGGTFWGGTFRGGTFWGGTFEGGTFRGGTFEGGTFWGGTFEGGTFRGGTFEGGTFRGGTFEGGTFWGGTFRGGTFEGGTFEGGTFRGGTFEGGTFRGGTFWGGTFRGGTFEGGTGFTVAKVPVVLLGLRWEVTITDKHMTIGCQHHTINRWWGFSDKLIEKMDSKALEFWGSHKATLQAICAASGRTEEEPDGALEVVA